MTVRALRPLVTASWISGLVALAAGCDGGAAPAPGDRESDKITANVGKGDCPDCRVRVRCEEEPARPGITTPLFRSVDDPHRYYALPTRWAVSDARATYWLASSFQYFDTRDIAGFDKNSFDAILSLSLADSEEGIVQALRGGDIDAEVTDLPLSSSYLEKHELNHVGYGDDALTVSWDAAALLASLHIDGGREAVEASTIFFAKGVGVGLVSARLEFECEDETGRRTRTVYPQAGGIGVASDIDGIPVDFSAGDVTNEADQVMVQVALILPHDFPDTAPPIDEIAALLKPLLAYDQRTDAQVVRDVGLAVGERVEAWAEALVAAGESLARVDERLEMLRWHYRWLLNFVPEIRVHEMELE